MNSPLKQHQAAKPMSPPKKYDASSFIENSTPTESNACQDQHSAGNKSRKSRKARKQSQGSSFSGLPPHYRSNQQMCDSQMDKMDEEEVKN